MRFPTLLAAALLLTLPRPALAAPGAVAPGLAERVANEGRAAVIVELAEPALPEGWLAPDRVAEQRHRVISAQVAAIYDLAGSDAGPARPYPVVPFLAMTVGPRGLEALAASPAVAAVRPSRPAAPHLDTTVPITQADRAWQELGFDGAGQAVVVLDTGTDLGHDNFPAWKELTEACFADGATHAGLPQNGGGDCPGGGDTAFGPGAAVPCDYHDECFHGTHVAGIAAGDGAVRPGVAPGAGLIPIQVFSEFPGNEPGCGGVPCPRSWTHDSDAALLYVYDTLRLQHTIAAVNMSLGSGAYTDYCDDDSASTKAIIDQLRSVGIATVVSTGNNGCGGTGCSDAISSPACVSSAVSVSATHDDGSIPAWANRAPFMSILAPGRSVAAPYYNTTNQFTFASGTSQAAPHVAGAWAILRQAVPTASVTTLLTALQDSGEVLNPYLGYERIQIRDALGLLGFPECDDAVDNDGDGLVDGDDPGCADASDTSERDAALACDDGVDNDGDGDVDTADPGCFGPGWVSESPACSDGLDNDGDGGTDFDGSPPDDYCDTAYQNAEAPGCGLGAELAWLLPLLAAARRRRR